MTFEVETKDLRPKANFISEDTNDGKSIKSVIQFLKGSLTTIKFSVDDTIKFKSAELKNITNYTIHKNGGLVGIPFTVSCGDLITVDIVKTDSNQLAEIVLSGDIEE